MSSVPRRIIMRQGILQSRFLPVGGALAALALLSATAAAQVSLPTLGGGGAAAPGGAVGPAVGPISPAVPNVPGVPGIGPTQPGQSGGVLPPATRNVVPNTLEKTGVNNNANNGNLVGNNVPLTISGPQGSQGTTPLGALIDSRNGRLLVRQVQADSLLSKAGVQSGDQLLAVDRQWVRSMGDLSSRLSAVAQNGGTAVLYLDRNGVKQWLNVDFSSNTRPQLGIQMKDGN
jgi:hypothetical protein